MNPQVEFLQNLMNLLGGDWNHGIFNDFPIILGMEYSSQLTNSFIFVRGIETTNQRIILNIGQCYRSSDDSSGFLHDLFMIFQNMLSDFRFMNYFFSQINIMAAKTWLWGKMFIF